MEDKSRAKNEDAVDEAFGYFRAFGHDTAGLKREEDPQTFGDTPTSRGSHHPLPVRWNSG